MPPSTKVAVRLTPDQRAALERTAATGVHAVHTTTRARILLKVDASGPDAWSDERVAQALDVCRMTVTRVRRQFAAEGLDATIHKKKPTGRQYRKLDGEQEARLVSLACSAPPDGRARWTMRLLADALVELEVVQSIDPATVCRTLQKTSSNPGSSSNGSFRPSRTPRSSPRWKT